MIIEALALGGLGCLAAMGLGAAAKIFYVEVDPLVAAIEEALPGANCGGCGYAGCATAAANIATGKMAPNGCVGGGPEVGVAVAAILGVAVTEVEPQVAQVGCRYPTARADRKYLYDGAPDCRAAVLLAGGPKECPVGCIGLGSCVNACPFGALSIGPDGLPVVDHYLCTGCGTCERTCPMGIMHLTSVSNRILDEITEGDCSAPCQRRCPAGIDIPKQINRTAQGDYDGALAVIKERNPLPLICGRICPHPCEEECRRNLADEPVAINPLKRFVADRERASGQHVIPYKAPATGRKVAVIGGGVEGLSTAYFLARLGHSPTVFEAQDKLGGMLRSVISPSRLPREVLDWEIEGILAMGVEARTGQVFGQDFDPASLFGEGFEAVVAATGGWDAALLMGQPGQTRPSLPGLQLLLPLNLAWAKGQEVDLGSKVVLVGGREMLATARQCREHGAGSVTILFTGSREALGLGEAELRAAEDEGIVLHFAARVTGLQGDGGKLTGLSFQQPPSNGGQPSEQMLPADSVVATSGRAPGVILVPDQGLDDDGKPMGTAWHTVMPYSPPVGGAQGLFAAEEAVSDFRAAVEAIGAGRRAAASMQAIMEGKPAEGPEGMLGQDAQVLDVNKLFNLLDASPRQLMPVNEDAVALEQGSELELGLDEEAARQEAQRCLNCGLICYRRTQYS
ncbi:MAG: FAD-dependent oxidoreductase [Desulfarculaceae bacterium]|nr:FAD-dependent oxidoreductase [Desulfarculaceae bacterium]MCF8072062.1 FAD-dependent oxidoreductase [Desulfarculaceae bacterium]MCF8101579.1 FAD-dependent oxidoreductase [Desulfarculaceae bacterium]MCF8115129.1 FAD-dependent oxidoreductase [Desulfarculaceae bacterium]